MATAKFIGGNDVQTCRDHPEANVIEDNRTSDRVCSECGLVLRSSNVDLEAEWRTFQGRENTDQSRVGGPVHPLLTGSELGTTIDILNGSTFDMILVGKNEIRGSDRSLVLGFNLIEKVGIGMGINKNIRNLAENNFKETYDKLQVLKQKVATNALAAAAIYVACRQEGLQIFFNELCRQSNCKKLQVGRYFRVICKELDIYLEIVTSTDYIEPLCTKLGLAALVKESAGHVTRLAEEASIVPGRTPNSVAAAAIYMVCQASAQDQFRTRKAIAQAAGISEGAISASYKSLYLRAEQLFPRGFKFTTPIEELPLS